MVQADAADLRLPRRPFRVVANPPFGSTHALIRRLVSPGSRLIAAHLVVPRHVARRWTGPDAPARARWSQVVSHVARGGGLPRTAFHPPPPHGPALVRSPLVSPAARAPSVRVEHGPDLRWPPMSRVLSGIQPSGELHLGNYLGAVRHWVADQDRDDCFYCIVDLHALTLEIDPAELRARTRETALDLLAAGLDPDRCTLFVQSQVPEHTRLSWLLECTATMGELRRMTQFKDKSEGRDSVRVGLFTYPVLQAADILLYDAERVPVGDDQRQHLELARELAQRFNHRYGDTFVVPDASVPAVGARVMDLQYPERKMSKSVSSPLGTVLLFDEPDEIVRKVRKAVTDTEATVALRPRGPSGRGQPARAPGRRHRPAAPGPGRVVRQLRPA